MILASLSARSVAVDWFKVYMILKVKMISLNFFNSCIRSLISAYVSFHTVTFEISQMYVLSSSRILSSNSLTIGNSLKVAYEDMNSYSSNVGVQTFSTSFASS